MCIRDRYNIPTARYEVFSDPAEALRAIRARNTYPTVVKADGLALGKGVLICENEAEAMAGVDEIMVDKKFGAAGNTLVIEEFLTGPEVSVLSFCDGKTVVPMVSAQDHKRALDGDQGLNTGGMGTFSPSQYYTCLLYTSIDVPFAVTRLRNGRDSARNVDLGIN